MTLQNIAITLAIGYGFGILSGSLLILALVRKLGRKAKVSSVALSLFQRLTKYRAAIYNIPRQPMNISVTVHGDNDDNESLTDILQRQMGFPAATAKQAVKHTMNEATDKPMEEKIRVALSYLDSQNKHIFTTN